MMFNMTLLKGMYLVIMPISWVISASDTEIILVLLLFCQSTFDFNKSKNSQSTLREVSKVNFINILPKNIHCIPNTSPRNLHVKISQLVASLQISCQQVVFALFVTSCQQVWNKLLTTCDNLVDIIRFVTRLFQQGCYNHDITLLLPPCVVNLVTFLLYHDCIRLVRTTL